LKCKFIAARPFEDLSIAQLSIIMAFPAMLQNHNPLDVDMAALKKGEIDLGTSMYNPSFVDCL